MKDYFLKDHLDEVEFNVVVYTLFRAGTEPEIGVAGYLNGKDQSKTYGNYRINVPCDSAVAVTAGSSKYGEVKSVAGFDFNVPDVNDPGVYMWWIGCFANTEVQQVITNAYQKVKPPKPQTPYIFDLPVNTNLAGASSYSSFSLVPAYANLNDKNNY